MSSIYIEGPIATFSADDLDDAYEILNAQHTSLCRLEALDAAEKIERVMNAMHALANDSDCIMLDGKYEAMKGIVGFGSRVRVKSSTVKDKYLHAGLFGVVTSVQKNSENEWRVSFSSASGLNNDWWYTEKLLELKP